MTCSYAISSSKISLIQPIEQLAQENAFFLVHISVADSKRFHL
jgi:hypothetical protein